MRAATVKLAVRNLLLHKLRSALTMLGTILGVSSVIAMLAIGEGSKQEAVEQIRQLGSTNVIVRSVKPMEKGGGPADDDSTSSATQSSSEQVRVLEYGLEYSDSIYLDETIALVDDVVPVSLVRKEVRRSSHRIANARVLGVPPDFEKLKKLRRRRGRFIESTDMRDKTNVVVLGAGASRRLFGFEDPLHQTVHVGEVVFRVVGVLAPRDSGVAAPAASGSDDQNDDLYIPLTSSRARFGDVQMIQRAGSREFERNELHEITLRVEREEDVGKVASMARRLLDRTHPNSEDIEILVPLELLEQAEREKRLWNIVLGSIAGIALVVGGIGIMNIMLATVTERTREIGLRRALGAKQADITRQFLIETIVLSATGGVLGVLLGVGIPIFVDTALEIRAALSWWAILVAFGMAVCVGVVFGIYPARRAAMMDPIEALRRQ